MRADDILSAYATAGRTRRSALHILGGTFALNGCPALARLRGAGTPADPLWGDWYPLDVTHRYLTLPATVNGMAVTAVVDSGATRSVIRENLAESLGLSRRGAITAAAIAKDVTGFGYDVSELRIGSVIARDLRVASYDMVELEASIDHAIPLVLGQDVLGLALLEVQFAKGRIGFGSGGGTAKARTFNLIGVDRGYPALRTSFEGGPAAPAFIDLGSNVVCAMSKAFAETHGFLTGRPVSTTLSVGVDGPQVGPIFCLRRADIGPFALRDIPVSVVDPWMLGAPVSFGWPIFEGFDLGLDLGRARMQLSVDTPAKLTAFPKDRSGLGASRGQDRIVIRHVALASPAEKAGLRAGDVVVAINGRSIDASYPAPGQRQGFQPVGTIIDLGMQDGRAVRLQLADYF